jgi:hypothetical protein
MGESVSIDTHSLRFWTWPLFGRKKALQAALNENADNDFFFIRPKK